MLNKKVKGEGLKTLFIYIRAAREKIRFFIFLIFWFFQKP